ncbi:MAG: hypothetical protein CR986_04490 [Ignavibacteriae bacterium]|nr:MAG: hypothetical protein CR986_04490 [Ignavibacteriota bacterium]
MKKTFYTILFLILSAVFVFPQTNLELYSFGMQNYENEDYAKAIASFNKIIIRDNVEYDLLSSAEFYIGESLVGLNQKDGAITQFENFISEYPTSNFIDLVLYRLGNLYFEKEQYSKSRESLIKLVIKFPNSEYSGSAYYLIGQSFIKENNLNEAETFFKSAVDSPRNNKFNVNSIYALANLYESKNDYKKAVYYYDKLLGYYGNSKLAPLVQMRIGICYYYLEEYESAILELSDPLILQLSKTKQNEADFILANAYYEIREFEKASRVYKKILKNSPTAEMLDQIRYGLAWINFQQGKYHNSFDLFNGLRNSKNDSLAVKSFYWSGEAKRYEGNYDESIEIHRQFVEKYPNHPYSQRVRLNIGISKFEKNDFTESEESLKRSLNSNDKVTKAKSLTLLGEIKLRNKDYQTSIDYFNKGLEISQIPNELRDRCLLGLGVAHFYRKDNISAGKKLRAINVEKTKVDLTKLYFYKAESEFYLGHYYEALENYKKINTSDSKVLKNVMYGKAYCYFNLKDFNKAIYYFNQFIKDYPNNRTVDECNLRLADSYYGTKSFNKAAKYYRKALLESNTFKDDDKSHFNYSQALFKGGKISEAINFLDQFQKDFPASRYADEAQYLIAWIYFQNSDFENAIENYDKLISNYSSSPLIPIAYYSIGDSYFNKGEYLQAIEMYQRLIRQFPNSKHVFDAVNGIQYAYVVQDKQDKAINFITEFIADNRHLDFIDKIKFKKAEIFYSSGNYQSAIVEYEKIIEDHPTSPLVPSAYYWMGKSANMLNENEKAAQYLLHVIHSSPQTEVGFNSVLELGRIYRKEKRYNKEIELYDNTLALISNDSRAAEIKYVKAQNYIEQENLSEAYTTLTDIVNSRNKSLFYHKAEIELAILESEQGNNDNAIMLLEDVVKSREDDIAAQAQYLIGLNYFNQERFPKAITELIKGRSLYSAYDEWYTKSLMLLGDSYVKINDKAKAADMYKSVIKRHRNDILGKEAKEKLNSL